MDESDDEQETEGIVNKVLDEIGIEISGKVGTVMICTLMDYFPKGYILPTTVLAASIPKL